MRGLKELKKIKSKSVLVRVDFNVPILNGEVLDDYRIKKALPTIEYLQKKGAKIVLISHMSKGDGGLAPAVKALNKYTKARFIPEVLSDNVIKEVALMKDGEIVMLENLRNDPGEQNKDKIFALELSKLADVYVNEAFSVSHRDDTSITLLPKIIPAYAGLQLEAEIKNLSEAYKKPKHPFLLILGGAKFSTKLPLVEKFLDIADKIYIGGALANDALESRGYEVGKSLVDDELSIPEKILENKKLILPVDVLVQAGKERINKESENIGKHDIIIDLGEQSIKELKELIKKAKFILWNGPLGKYEDLDGGATKEILKAVAESKAKSIIGGGDTAEMINELDLEKEFSFVSTGGGAMLKFLENGTLPGIEVLK